MTEDIIFPEIESMCHWLLYLYYTFSSKPAMHVDDCIKSYVKK